MSKIRIRIIGGCGSGKSYTARELSKRYGIPYFETDNGSACTTIWLKPETAFLCRRRGDGGMGVIYYGGL
ncbi:hypothetical protein JI735_14875 [Paenibacillus sonchi]|uniref:Shikimate kinase n=1 Tax=Paenibacillus sonchi TaxID=373687 RepID=A0A974PJK2_9BACL|nr:hypothetical protein [Paenibacillus sonchi]QQZ64462.1 hypothetical protein JI735_14875 [Paenibacillus sonchi]